MTSNLLTDLKEDILNNFKKMNPLLYIEAVINVSSNFFVSVLTDEAEVSKDIFCVNYIITIAKECDVINKNISVSNLSASDKRIYFNLPITCPRERARYFVENFNKIIGHLYDVKTDKKMEIRITPDDCLIFECFL